MKCLRCGKEFKDKNREFCDECGYDFKEGQRLNKLYNEKSDPDVPEHQKTDLVDYPILSFILSIIGLIFPVLVCSVIAIILSKKPSKASLIPFAHLGYVFGILGIGISSLTILIFIIWLL